MLAIELNMCNLGFLSPLLFLITLQLRFIQQGICGKKASSLRHFLIYSETHILCAFLKCAICISLHF
ncbi:hypothetical protein FGO68_gene436 [Halteria grandinella]|uniref:Uncharacterized protein n=1 Tax=Halteria grandinella TaxID=5974 RepID=A0A8J8NCC9_HALGN|nr:hypothetical protein FGO68_gene436 [Halteria grandinella]